MRPPDEDRDHTGRWLVALFAAVLLVGAGVGYLALSGNAAQDQTAATAAQSVAVADPVLELCAGGDDVARALWAKGACGAAAVVRADPIPGTPGEAGTPGVDGADGRDGRDGNDGVSPACLTEPRECRGVDGIDGKPGVDGQDGQNGTDGKDGTDGNDGAAGKPPAGFTFTDSAGRAQTCTRDVASPDDAATYTCTAPAAEPTSMRLTSVRSAP